MAESPLFAKLKAEGKTSKAPLTDSYGTAERWKVFFTVLLGATAGQAVVWYTGQFYALIFLQNVLKIPVDTSYEDRRGRALLGRRRSSSCSARCRTASAARRSS